VNDGPCSNWQQSSPCPQHCWPQHDAPETPQAAASCSHGLGWQVPCDPQNGLAPLQTTPHLPQFFGSFVTLTHVPPQHENPIPQAGEHAPPPLDDELPPDELPLPDPLLLDPPDPPLLAPPEPEPDDEAPSVDASLPPPTTLPPQLPAAATAPMAATNTNR